MKARTAIVRRHGGPAAIEWIDRDLPAPGAGEVLIRHGAIGVNFIDCYYRAGIYPMALPGGLGIEAAGIVEAVGEGVSALVPGDRVGAMKPPLGAYATARLMRAVDLVRLPDDVDDETAAAMLVKGCTAEFLIERCAKVEPGWVVLVHAAAGATGLLLVQWLKAIGASVIGTVGTAAKAEVARAAGADHVILYREEDTAARVRALTGRAGVHVVFDGVGMATWDASLDSCARRGLIVSFGNADAPVTGINPGVLALKGSLTNSRPTLWDYYADPGEAAAGAARMFAMLRTGAIRPYIGQRFSLEDAAAAHAALETRETVGATILLP
ncbi:quinone oxidoreductase [uncultured Sphingomonas sp.]|uniref:quinone oxidoreductase family protein n=1 Tax=uncultured Sphingomonas sp. TaxID=158754 RepID=UPI00261563FE|nr:quinone oxidoreductase [uncultured Sphingomonas sp.]